MKRQQAWVMAAIAGLVAAASAQPENSKPRDLPFFEQQLAGIRLGLHAQSLTGIWEMGPDTLTYGELQWNKRTYAMPDHIIMRVGTRLPVMNGTASGQASTMNFLLGGYGRTFSGGSNTTAGGASSGGSGGSSGPGGSGGPGGMRARGQGQAEAEGADDPPISDLEVKARVHQFLARALGEDKADDVPLHVAQAQMGLGDVGAGMAGAAALGGGGGGIGRTPSQIAAAATGAASRAGGAAAGALGGGDLAAAASAYTSGGAGAVTQVNWQNLQVLMRDIGDLYYAPREHVLEVAKQLYAKREKTYQDLFMARAENQDQKALDLQTEVDRMAAELIAIQGIMGSSDAYHIFHVGQPGRDIVFVYTPAPDIWVSFTINFFTWQIDGITVCGYGPWDGAETSGADYTQVITKAEPGAKGKVVTHDYSRGHGHMRGVRLGDPLEHVLDRYGWPNAWESFYGRYMLIHYYDDNNVGFLLDHPSPKVWKVVRIIIQPRPFGTERQLCGFRLGEDAQDLLVERAGRGYGPVAYGEPYIVERPNHRITVVDPGQDPTPENRPPGMLLDRRLDPCFAGGGGGGAGAGPGSGSGGSSAPGAPPSGGSSGPARAYGLLEASAAAAQAEGAATDPLGRPVALAQPPPSPNSGSGGSSMPGGSGGAGAGGAGGATATILSPPRSGVVMCRFPMPFFYSLDTFNVEESCHLVDAGKPADGSGGGSTAGGGAGSGGGAPRSGGGGSSGGSAAPRPSGASSGGGPGNAPSSGGGGAGGGGGDSTGSRQTLATCLNNIYLDATGQTGFTIAFGCRATSGDCHINTCVSETQYRWDYIFQPDVRAEFGIDSDGLCTQIGVMGTRWGGARTERGVKLGSTLGDVLLDYGPPLLYNEFTIDQAEVEPNFTVMSYAIGHGRPAGNINFTLENNHVTAIQIAQLGVK
jgi:hypothetical protein